MTIGKYNSKDFLMKKYYVENSWNQNFMNKRGQDIKNYFYNLLIFIRHTTKQILPVIT